MKTYSKRKSIITLIVFALALAGILLMVLLGIGFEHVGRWDQFGKGLDLEGGVSITYQAKEGASQQDMDDTIMKLQERTGVANLSADQLRAMVEKYFFS